MHLKMRKFMFYEFIFLQQVECDIEVELSSMLQKIREWKKWMFSNGLPFLEHSQKSEKTNIFKMKIHKTIHTTPIKYHTWTFIGLLNHLGVIFVSLFVSILCLLCNFIDFWVFTVRFNCTILFSKTQNR